MLSFVLCWIRVSRGTAWIALNRNFRPLIWQTIKLWGNYCQWCLSATHVPGEYGFKSRPDLLMLVLNWNFPVCNGWRNRAWQPLSDENSQSNWRNLSEDNETGVDLEHHWKNIINDIVLCIFVPIHSKYESGKYRHLFMQAELTTLSRSLCAIIHWPEPWAFRTMFNASFAMEVWRTSLT